MYTIKQSTALTLPFFVHDVNGDAVTALTDGSFTKRISKNGAAFGAMTVTITELENGWYSIPLSTAHSDTLGLLSVTFTNAGAKQVNLQWRVEANLVDDNATLITTVDTVVDGIQTDLDNATDGLGALKTLIDAIQTDLDNGTDGLGALATLITTVDTVVDGIQTDLSNATDGLGAIKADTAQTITDIAALPVATDIVSAGAITTLAGAVVNVDLVDTTTTNTDMRGTDSAALASVATEARLAELDAANLPADVDDLATRVPAALVGGRMDADIGAVSTSTGAATKMEQAFESIVTGVVGVGSTTTAIVLTSTDPTLSGNDQMNGKILTFTDATTTAILRGQSTDITDYDHGTVTLTVTALTTAPVSGDTFIVT